MPARTERPVPSKSLYEDLFEAPDELPELQKGQSSLRTGDTIKQKRDEIIEELKMMQKSP